MFKLPQFVLAFLLVPTIVLASDQNIVSWRDENGVMHYSDNVSGITESYAPAPALPEYSKAPQRERRERSSTKPRKTTSRAGDDTATATTTMPLAGECEWLRGRIATLRRLTRGNPNSAFNDELYRRQKEWKKEQCQHGTHVINRELTPSRKVKIKS